MKNIKAKTLSKIKLRNNSVQVRRTLIWGAVFGMIGIITLLITHAASPFIAVEAEQGSIAGGAMSMSGDNSASGSGYVMFKAPMGGMGQIPASQLPKGNPIYATSRLLLDPGVIDKFSVDGTGNFRIVCEFSHMSYDDPIAFPGQQGAAHLHTFFGNTGANYTSTHASLVTAGTSSTCPGGAANLSAYWFPTMMSGGTPLAPSLIGVYYKSEFLPAATINDVPQGIKMIAGNKNSLTAQNQFIVYWQCLETGVNGNGLIPNCPVGDQVEMDVAFPSCWDGVNLDAADHISHVHYPGLDPQPPGTIGHYGDGCSKETGHTVPIPTITVKGFWRVPAAGSGSLRLSS